MQYAFSLAEKAKAQGEVPIGAVVVLDNKIIGEGFNQPIASHDPCAHAEIMALRSAGKTIQNYRLPGSVLYVTLEPCGMCLGAMAHARIAELVYGASDPKKQTHHVAYSNHQFKITSGVLEKQCGDLLRDFFREKRG